MTARESAYDVAIVGAGIVGLTLAAALAQANCRVAIIDARQPTLTWDADAWDARVCALHPASVRYLTSLSVWSSITPTSRTPIDAMQVWDALGGGAIQFSAAEAGLPTLGFIVENRALIQALMTQLRTQQNVSWWLGETPASLTTSPQAASLTLASGTCVRAALLVGADGARSWVRDQIPAGLATRAYVHHAIIAVITTEKPHQLTAWQSFKPDGPLGVLPLSHPHRAAIVWSVRPEQADALMCLDEAGFNRALTNGLDGRLGALALCTPRQVIPLVARSVKHDVQARLALIGDAAHTIHPLAGQGANLGLMDVKQLAQTLIAARDLDRDIGSLRVLRQYARARKGEVQRMQLAMRGFQTLFASTSPIWVPLRSQGLSAVDRCGWLKRWFIVQ